MSSTLERSPRRIAKVVGFIVRARGCCAGRRPCSSVLVITAQRNGQYGDKDAELGSPAVRSKISSRSSLIDKTSPTTRARESEPRHSGGSSAGDTSEKHPHWRISTCW
jgi:hypothetical protein